MTVRMLFIASLLQDKGWTALMVAASEDHVQVVSYLLVSGANPNVLARVSG